MSAMWSSWARVASRRGLSGCKGPDARGPVASNTPGERIFAPIPRTRDLTPGSEGRCCAAQRSIKVISGRVDDRVGEPGRGTARHPAGRSPAGRDRPATRRGERGAGVIDDRMRGPGQGATTVWVYDERRRVRDDIASRLVALPFVGRVEVVGDAQSLLQRLATRTPDVLLVGTQRAVDSGLTVATQALPSSPNLPVLVLGAPDDAETVRAAVALGARGYLRWDALPIEMGLGLSRVGLRADGRIPAPAPPRELSSIGASTSSWGGAAPLAGSQPTTVRSTVRELAPVSLSMREMQVLTGMSQGKSNAQIGRELYLSEDTIKTHARRLFRKLGAKDRAEAVATGFRRGMMQ